MGYALESQKRMGGLISTLAIAATLLAACATASGPIPAPTETDLTPTPWALTPTTTPYPTSRDRPDPTETALASTLTPTATPWLSDCQPLETPTPWPSGNPIIIDTFSVPIRWFIGLGPGADPAQLQMEQAVTDEFKAAPERATDNIPLQMEVVPYDYAKDTLTIEIGAGNGPDVIGPVGWADANALPDEWMDLSSLIKKTHYDTSQIDPALLEMSRNERGLLGLPFALYPAAVEFNAALFEKAGLQPPPAKTGQAYTLPDGSPANWDWDTLAKISQLLTLDADGRNATQPGFDTNHIVQYGFTWGHEIDPALTASFWQAGSLLAPGGTPGSYRATIPTAWRAAWQWSYDGMHGPQPFIAFGPAADAFENGRAAMTIETTRYLSSFGKVKSFQFAALPAYQGRVSRRLEVETFRLWKNTRNPDQAFFVLTYLLGQGAHKLLVECNGFPPAYNAVPLHRSDRQAFLAVRRQQFPWITTWDTLLASTTDPQSPAGEGSLPNFTQAWARISAFGARMETIRELDLATEEATLEHDLTTLFNQ